MRPMATGFSLSALFTDQWRLWVHILLVVVLFGFGVGSRLYRIHDETPWHDENITWSNIEMPRLSDYIAQLRSRDATFVPAYYVLLYYWSKATCHSVTAARVLSVCTGAAAMLLLYMLGRLAFGPLAGLVALAFLSLSNTHVYFSQEIRVYPLYVTAAILSMLMLFLALKHNQRRHWALHQGANCVLVLSHYFGALIVIAQGLYLLLFHGRPLRRLLVWGCAQALLAGLVILWMRGIDREVLRMTTAFLQPRPVADLVHCYAWTALYWPVSWYRHSGLTWGVLAAIMFLGLFYFRRRNQSEHDTDRWRFYILCVLWLVFPMTAAIIATYTAQPVIMLRYMLPASAAFFLLVGGAIGTLPWTWARWATTGALIAMLFWHHMGDPRPFRPNYQSAGRLIAEHMGDNDMLLISFGLAGPDRRQYFDIPQERVKEYGHENEIAERAATLLEQYDAVWTVCMFPYGEGYAPYQEIETAMAAYGLNMERRIMSDGHHSFAMNGNWPTLFDGKMMVVVHRLSADNRQTGGQELFVPPQPAP